MLYSKYPPDLVKKALDLSSRIDFLLRQDIVESVIHDATVWLPSLGQELGLPSVSSVCEPPINWKQIITTLFHCTLLTNPESRETPEEGARRWHLVLSAMGETAFPYLYDTLPERQFMKISQQEIVTASTRESAPHLPWDSVPSWKWGHYASIYLDIPESNELFWHIKENNTGWTTAHMASLHGRIFASSSLLHQQTRCVPLGLILDSSQSKRQKTTLKMLSVASVYYLAGFVFPQVNEYLKAPFDSVKTTVIEAILSKGTKHQDPSWLSGALRNLYILYGKLPLEKIGRLAALLFRRLQALLYSEQLLRSTISDMGKLFSKHAGKNATERVLRVFEGMVPEYSYWLIPT